MFEKEGLSREERREKREERREKREERREEKREERREKREEKNLITTYLVVQLRIETHEVF